MGIEQFLFGFVEVGSWTIYSSIDSIAELRLQRSLKKKGRHAASEILEQVIKIRSGGFMYPESPDGKKWVSKFLAVMAQQFKSSYGMARYAISKKPMFVILHQSNGNGTRNFEFVYSNGDRSIHEGGLGHLTKRELSDAVYHLRAIAKYPIVFN